MFNNIYFPALIVEYTISVIKRLKHKIQSKDSYTNFSITNLYRMNNEKKTVVYTCVTGNYDFISSPLLKLPNTDYVLFTDKIINKKSNWIIRDIPDFIKEFSKQDQNRYIKMHPHELFLEEYDYSIYVDGKIHILGDIVPLTNHINRNTGLALFKHGFRDNVYDEAEVLIKANKGNTKKIKSQIESYREEGLPENSGLFEMAVIVTELSNSFSRKLLDSWWEEYIYRGSMRALSLNDIGDLGVNYGDNPKWIAKAHK